MKVQFTGWPAFVLFLAVFLTVYAPVVLTPYAFNDDFFNLAEALQKSQSGLIIQKISEGRPLHALLTDVISFRATRDIGGLRYLRFVGVLGITVLAWSVFRLLVRTGCGHAQSFCVCVIMATTPSFQIYAAWATTAFYSYSALVSGLAFALAERAVDEQRRLPKWLLGAGASLALLIALTIYQPAAMFFWVFAAVVVLKPETPQRDMIRRLVGYCFIVMTGLLLGFGVYILGSLYLDHLARGGLVQDIPRKAVWFFRDPLPNAVNFVSLSPSHWLFPEGPLFVDRFHRAVNISIGGSIFIFVLGGLALYFQGTRKERLQKLGVAVSLLPLSYLPQLVAFNRSAVYRGLLSLTSIVVVYMFFAFQGYAQHLRRPLSSFGANAVIGSVALASALLATYHVQTYFVAPQVQELEIMRSQLTQKDLSSVRGIYVICSTWRDTLAPLVRYDEFGFPSSAVSWAARAMVFLLLRDMAPDYAHLPITVVSADDPIEPSSDSLVVDMRNLRLQAQRDDSGP